MVVKNYYKKLCMNKLVDFFDVMDLVFFSQFGDIENVMMVVVLIVVIVGIYLVGESNGEVFVLVVVVEDRFIYGFLVNEFFL